MAEHPHDRLGPRQGPTHGGTAMELSRCRPEASAPRRGSRPKGDPRRPVHRAGPRVARLVPHHPRPSSSATGRRYSSSRGSTDREGCLGTGPEIRAPGGRTLGDDELRRQGLDRIDSDGDPLVRPRPRPESARRHGGAGPGPTPTRRLIHVGRTETTEPADRAVPLAPETFDDVTEIADRVAEGWMIELSLDRVGPDLRAADHRLLQWPRLRTGRDRRSGPSDYLLSAPMPPLTAWESDLRRLA